MQPDTKEENMFFPDGNSLILNEQEQKQCEGFLNASECLESLKSMESNKSALEVTASQPNSIKSFGMKSMSIC